MLLNPHRNNSTVSRPLQRWLARRPPDSLPCQRGKPPAIDRKHRDGADGRPGMYRSILPVFSRAKYRSFKPSRSCFSQASSWRPRLPAIQLSRFIMTQPAHWRRKEKLVTAYSRLIFLDGTFRRVTHLPCNLNAQPSNGGGFSYASPIFSC